MPARAILTFYRSGYCPYPAGGLCYKDGRMRYLVTWTSPVVYRDSDQEDSIGIYGVEGSKPGAAAGKPNPIIFCSPSRKSYNN